MSKPRILVIEDSPEYQIFLKALLNKDGELFASRSLSEARQLVFQVNPHFILLDIGLGEESGLDFCNELKRNEKTQDIAIAFLTARENIEAKLQAFSLGAEDYIVKNADPLEIQARVQSLLRRRKNLISSESFICGGLRIDFTLQKVALVDSPIPSEDLHLTPTEFKILAILMMNEGQTLSRKRLLEEIRGSDVSEAGRTVDTHVHSLRRKLSTKGSLVQSAFGEGYRFNSKAEIEISKEQNK